MGKQSLADILNLHIEPFGSDVQKFTRRQSMLLEGKVNSLEDTLNSLKLQFTLEANKALKN